MYFDGSSTSTSAGVGIIIQSPHQAKYEALVIGFSVLHDLHAARVLIFDELAQIASGAQLLRGKRKPMIPVLRQSCPALVNQQVLQRDQVIRTRVMSLPSLLEREDPVDVCVVEMLPNDWRRPIMQYLDNPRGKHNRKTKVNATNYVSYQNELY
ncbi:hypothetical protein ACFXTI_031950 [Malus domestica]